MSYAVNTKEMAICFIIELVLLLVFSIKRVELKKDTKINSVLLLTTTIVLCIIQFLNYKNGIFEKYDIINIGCIFLNILMLYIIFLNFEIEEKYIYAFFFLMVCLGLIACAVNLYLYKEEILTMFTQAKQISVKSFFAHRNQFAIFLYASIISNIILILRNKKIINKILLFIPLIILGINLLLTTSRTGIFSTVLFLILFFITTSSIKFKYKFLVIFIVITIVLVGATIILNKYPNIEDKVIAIIDNLFIRESSIKSFTGRDNFWKIAQEKLCENGINLSFGIGRFYAITLIEKWDVTQFHNSYVEALMTGGIMELAFFMFIHIYVFIKIIKSKIDKKYKLCYLSMYISLMVYGGFESLCRFSIGCADTICIIMFITIPLIHANSYNENEEVKDNQKLLKDSERK